MAYRVYNLKLIIKNHPIQNQMLLIITRRFPTTILLHQSINYISKHSPNPDTKPNYNLNYKSNPSHNQVNRDGKNRAWNLQKTVSKQNQFKQKIMRVDKLKEMNRILRDHIGDDIRYNSEIFAIACRFYSKLIRKINYDFSFGTSIIFGSNHQLLGKISPSRLPPSQLIDIISTINFSVAPKDAHNIKLRTFVEQALVQLLKKKSSIESNRCLSYFCKAARCAEFFGVEAYKDVLVEIFSRIGAIEFYQFLGLTNFLFRNRLDGDVVEMEIKIINGILDKAIEQKWLAYCAFNNFCDVLQVLLQYCNENMIYKEQIGKKKSLLLDQAIQRLQSQYSGLTQKQLNRLSKLFSQYPTPSSTTFLTKILNFMMKQIKPSGQCSINSFSLIKTIFSLSAGPSGIGVLRRVEPNWLTKLEAVMRFYYERNQCNFVYCVFVVLEALEDGLWVGINSQEAKKWLDMIQGIFRTHQMLAHKFESSLKNFPKPTIHTHKQNYITHVQSHNTHLSRQQIQQTWVYKFMQLRLCTLFSKYLKYQLYQQSAHILKQLSQLRFIQERKNLYFYQVFLEINQSFLQQFQVDRVVPRYKGQGKHWKGLDEETYFRELGSIKQMYDGQDIMILNQLLSGLVYSLKHTAKYKSFLSSLKYFQSGNSISLQALLKYLSFLSIPRYLHFEVIKVLQLLNSENDNTFLGYIQHVCDDKNVKSREGVLKADLFMQVLGRLWGQGKVKDKDQERVERLKVYGLEEVFVFLCRFARQEFISSLKSLAASNPQSTQLLTLRTLTFLVKHCLPAESIKFAQWALITHSKYNINKIKPSTVFRDLCIVVKDNYLMNEENFLELAGKSWTKQQNSQGQELTAIRQIKKEVMGGYVAGKIKEISINRLYKLFDQQLLKLQGDIQQIQYLIRYSLYFIKICYQKHKQNPKKLQRLAKLVQNLQQTIMLPVPSHQRQKSLPSLQFPIYQCLPLQLLFLYVQTTQNLPIWPPNPTLFAGFLQQLHSSAWKSKIKASQLCQLLMQSPEFRKVANQKNLHVLVSVGLEQLSDELVGKIQGFVNELGKNQQKGQNFHGIVTYLEYLKKQIKADSLC